MYNVIDVREIVAYFGEQYLHSQGYFTNIKAVIYCTVFMLNCRTLYLLQIDATIVEARHPYD